MAGLAGFSQGGAIVLHTGLRYEKRLGGILALSTYLPTIESLARERSQNNMEIPIMMVLLSRVLTYKANKIMNIITASIMAIVQTLSLFVGSPTVYYSFFSAIEITTNLFIIGIAWKWKGLRH